MHSAAIKASSSPRAGSQLLALAAKASVKNAFVFLRFYQYLLAIVSLPVIMATYAAYRHIELDKVGYSKKRVRNPSSEIFNVLCTPPSAGVKHHSTPRRSSHSDSFTRLFGPTDCKITPRRASLTKQDVKNRNPVTGNGVDSWDQKRNTPRVHNERNPVTGEVYTIVSPATTPTKPVQNGFVHFNGTSTPQTNGNPTPVVNGNSATD